MSQRAVQKHDQRNMRDQMKIFAQKLGTKPGRMEKPLYQVFAPRWHIREYYDGERATMKFGNFLAIVQDMDGDGSVWSIYAVLENGEKRLFMESARTVRTNNNFREAISDCAGYVHRILEDYVL